eukprot:SAG25_NODE_340_length_9458_cov_4.740571_10_plen_80_part_00
MPSTSAASSGLTTQPITEPVEARVDSSRACPAKSSPYTRSHSSYSAVMESIIENHWMVEPSSTRRNTASGSKLSPARAI